MYYKFNEELLTFTEVKMVKKAFAIVGIIATAITIISWSAVKIDKKLTERQVLIIMAQQNQFTEGKLVDHIKEMNFQFPYIVYAQALLETNNFHSRIFVENNNLFGMKEATQRVTLSKGSQNNHAYYKNWSDSVYDYGFYCATYLSKLKTEDDYYNYLSQSYAEDGEYVIKLKNIIDRENLKSKFN